MSIAKTIKAIKYTIKVLQSEIEKEQKTFNNYRRAVEKYKELCKHAATSQELTDALVVVSKAWHDHTTTRKNYANKSVGSG